MSRVMTVQQAAMQLEQILRSLTPGDEIVLTDQGQPMARIIPSSRRQTRRAGSAKGMLVINRDDDEHLEGFKDHMP